MDMTGDIASGGPDSEDIDWCAWREGLGLSRAAAARALGITSATLAGYEQKRRRAPATIFFLAAYVAKYGMLFERQTRPDHESGTESRRRSARGARGDAANAGLSGDPRSRPVAALTLAPPAPSSADIQPLVSDESLSAELLRSGVSGAYVNHLMSAYRRGEPEAVAEIRRMTELVRSGGKPDW